DFATTPMVAYPLAAMVGTGGLATAVDIRNGMRLWDREFPSIRHAWLAEELLLILTGNNQAAAMNAKTGRIYWTAALPFEGAPGEPSPWRFIMLAAGRVLVTGTHGKALWLDVQSGELQVTQDWPDNAHSLPIAVEDGWYLINRSASLIKLR